MLRSLMILTLSLNLYAQDSLEDQLMGTVEISEEEILAPLSQDDKKYLDSINLDDEEFEELKGEEFPDIDFQEVNALREKEQKSIIKIIKSPTASKLNYSETEALKVQLKDIIRSGTYLASVQKGTELVHVRTGKLHYAQKDLIVRAYRLKDYDGYQLLKNNNGYISYKALAQNVINIKEVTRMREPPEKFKPVEKQIKFDLNNAQVKYQTHFLVNAGLTRPMFLRDLINDESHFGQTVRYEGTVYGRWNFPLKVGFTTQWENNFGSFEDGKYNMQTLSLGPSFRSMPFKLITNEYYFVAQTRLAVFSKVAVTTTSGTANYNNSQTNLTLGIVREIQTKLGKFLIGFNYQRQWVKASADKIALDISSENNYNDAFSISFGHGSDWIW